MSLVTIVTGMVFLAIAGVCFPKFFERIAGM